MNNMLSFTQVLNLIAAVGDKRTVIVEGENGIGKTALFHALKHHPKFANHIAVDPVDCTQLSEALTPLSMAHCTHSVDVGLRILTNTRRFIVTGKQIGRAHV